MNQNCKLMAQKPLLYPELPGALLAPGEQERREQWREGFPGSPATQQNLSLPEGEENLTSGRRNAPRPYPNPWSNSQVRRSSSSSVPRQPLRCCRCRPPRLRRGSSGCSAAPWGPRPAPASPAGRSPRHRLRRFNHSPGPAGSATCARWQDRAPAWRLAQAHLVPALPRRGAAEQLSLPEPDTQSRGGSGVRRDL